MHIINLTPLAPGVYNDHKADHITAPPDGWAMIPEDFPLPSTFPRLGSIEAEELTYTREVEVQKEVVKTHEVERFKEVTKTRKVEKVREVVKTRTVETVDEFGNPTTVKEEYIDFEPYMATEEYVDFEPYVTTEEYTEMETVVEQQEYTMLTVTSMTEGTLPDPIPEPPAPKTNKELETENELLKAQVSALSDQLDFQEECLVEMASIVYA